MSSEPEAEPPKRRIDPEWRQLPYTAKLIAAITQDMKDAYESLLSAASVSTDPKMRAAFERYRALGLLQETLDLGMLVEEETAGPEASDNDE